MHTDSLDPVERIFSLCLNLEQDDRKALLRALEDPGIASRIRQLISADDSARRSGFLEPRDH
jgi:hypothetical protein